MKKKLNVAILGFGKMGQIRFKELKKRRDVKKILIYDPAIKKKSKTFVQSENDILKNKNINVLFICAPNFLNAKFTRIGLKNNMHVFCEKPPARNLHELNDIGKILKISKKKLMYGFNHRFHESVIIIKKIIDKKSLGKIYWMRGRYGKSLDKNFLDNWRSKKKFSGGGILIDQGIHMLDLFLFFVKDFDKVQAIVSNNFKNLEVEDNVFANFYNTKNKISASLHSTMTQWRHLFSLEIFFEKGNIILNGLKTPSGSYGQETLTITDKFEKKDFVRKWNHETKKYFKKDKSWTKEVDYFFKCIHNNRKVQIGNFNDAKKIMKMIKKIYNFKLN